MKFNHLSHDEKLDIQKELLKACDSVGGKNHFFQIIEDVKEASQHPLMNKTGKFHFKDGTITWKKEIFKEKVEFLKQIIKESDEENILGHIEKNKLKKQAINLAKTLVNLEFVVESKKYDGFSFKAIKHFSDENIEIEPMFQLIFFESVNTAKKIFKYK
ncbi:MAG: hypothetical protein IE909_02520 [Campylobacterales bacterium]|nr:hypothetical protein [Campylobacterales bacterium]